MCCKDVGGRCVLQGCWRQVCVARMLEAGVCCKDVGGRCVLSMASGSTGKDNVLVALRSPYGKSIYYKNRPSNYTHYTLYIRQCESFMPACLCSAEVSIYSIQHTF